MRHRLRAYIALIVLLSLTVSTHPTHADALPRADIVLWHLEDSDTMNGLGIQKIFDDWALTNAPGSTLTLVSKQVDDLEYDVESGNGAPDLIWTVADHVAPLVAAHRLQPVDALADMSAFVPALVDMARLDGKTYGLPIQAGNLVVLMYNKKYVQQPPQTFDELIAISQKLQQNAPQDFIPFAYDQGESYWVFPIAHAFGASEFAADGKTPALNTGAWLNTYQFLYDLKFKAKIEPDVCLYVCADKRFKNGNAAMILSGDWTLHGTDNYPKLLGDNLGVAPLPSVGNDPTQAIPTPFVVGRYLMISAGTTGDKLAVAQAFARFLATDKQTALSWTLPNNRLPALLDALKDEQVSNNPLLAPVEVSLLRALPLPMGTEATCVFQAVSLNVRNLVDDTFKPADVPPAAQKMAEDCIKQAKGS